MGFYLLKNITKLVFVSGILNILLGILHQINLYFNYQELKIFNNSLTTNLLSDYVLFSMGMGVTLLLLGFLSCYSYYGIKKKEIWAYFISSAVSCYLFLAAFIIVLLQGFSHFVIYVHLINVLLICIPLIVKKLSESNLSEIINEEIK